MQIHITPTQARELANQDVEFGITPAHVNGLRSLASQVESLTSELARPETLVVSLLRAERNAHQTDALMYRGLLETEIKARIAATEAEGVYRIMCEEAKPMLDERDTLRTEVQKLRSQCEGAEIVRAEAVKVATECKVDAARLAYVFSGQKTESMSLVNIHMRMINDDFPTIDEVRTAIDAAMQAAKDAS